MLFGESIGEFALGESANDPGVGAQIDLPDAVYFTLSLNIPAFNAVVTPDAPAAFTLSLNLPAFNAVVTPDAPLALTLTPQVPTILVPTLIILPGPVVFTLGAYQTFDTSIEETTDGSIGEFAIGEVDRVTQATSLTHPVPEIQARSRAVRIRTEDRLTLKDHHGS